MLLCGEAILLLLLDFDSSTLKGLVSCTLVTCAVIVFSLLLKNSMTVSVGMALHISIMILMALFMFRTPVADLLRGLQTCRIPDSLMLGFLVVFRFADVLRSELYSIYQASTMIPSKRISFFKKLYRCLIFPFVYRMFVLSDQLSISIETRDYGVTQRSRYRDLPIKAADTAVLVCTIVMSVVIIWIL